MLHEHGTAKPPTATTIDHDTFIRELGQITKAGIEQQTCDWCGIHCTGTVRDEHERLSRQSETGLRQRWAA